MGLLGKSKGWTCFLEQCLDFAGFHMDGDAMHIVSITKLLAGSAHAENPNQKYNASPLFLALNALQNYTGYPCHVSIP